MWSSAVTRMLWARRSEQRLLHVLDGFAHGPGEDAALRVFPRPVARLETLGDRSRADLALDALRQRVARHRHVLDPVPDFVRGRAQVQTDDADVDDLADAFELFDPADDQRRARVLGPGGVRPALPDLEPGRRGGRLRRRGYGDQEAQREQERPHAHRICSFSTAFHAAAGSKPGGGDADGCPDAAPMPCWIM